MAATKISRDTAATTYDSMENRLRQYVPLPVCAEAFWARLAMFILRWPGRRDFVRGKATFQSLSRSPLEGYFNSVSIFRPGEKPQAIHGRFRAHLGQIRFARRAGRSLSTAPARADLLSRIQYVDIKTYLPDDILAKVDRASMAVSLEVRAPLLDHKFMEIAAKIPSSLKLRGTQWEIYFQESG